MKYIAIIHGYGEGCHYTIGCNLDYEIFEAGDIKDAKKQVKELVEENYGLPEGAKEWLVEYVDIYEIGKRRGRVRFHRSP